MGYRFFVQRQAAKLGLNGFAENLEDGRVEVYAIGSEQALAQLSAMLHKGPSFASVSSVEEREESIDQRYADRFRIK